MAMWDSVQKAKRYRDRAEEILVIANSMRDADAKAFLIGVSTDYLMMAQVLERAFDPLPTSE